MREEKEFGAWVRQRRAELRLGLRQAALDAGIDAGNLSRYERGVIPAPQDEQTLHRLAKALRLKQGSPEYQQFVDLAAISAGRIPPDLASDRSLLEKLPVLFRSARKGSLNKAELLALVEALKSR